MTYTSSKAQAGRGTQFSIGPIAGTASPTYTLVGEVDESTPDGRKWNFDDASNFESGIDEESITTMRTPGNFKVTGNRVTGDAGQVALEAAHDSGGLYMFTVQLPMNAAAGQTTAGDKWAFNAYVESVDPSGIKVKNVIKFGASLRVSGARTFTAGS
jgi:hypothetical protein